MRTWRSCMRGASMALGLFSAATLHLTGCGSVGTRACTTEARASLTVTVMGPQGRICDADVVAQNGNDRTTLMAIGPQDCTYAGPWEKAGTFTVTASKSGFQPATTTVTVNQGECHVEGEAVTLTLSP
jgi:hypothetical protein